MRTIPAIFLSFFRPDPSRITYHPFDRCLHLFPIEPIPGIPRSVRRRQDICPGAEGSPMGRIRGTEQGRGGNPQTGGQMGDSAVVSQKSPGQGKDSGQGRQGGAADRGQTGIFEKGADPGVEFFLGRSKGLSGRSGRIFDRTFGPDEASCPAASFSGRLRYPDAWPDSGRGRCPGL